jgi:hypothetical protein
VTARGRRCVADGGRWEAVDVCIARGPAHSMAQLGCKSDGCVLLVMTLNGCQRNSSRRLLGSGSGVCGSQSGFSLCCSASRFSFRPLHVVRRDLLSMIRPARSIAAPMWFRTVGETEGERA